MADAIELRNILAELLVTELANYDPINKPAIWIVPPQLPSQYKIQKKLGVECIIFRTPEKVEFCKMGASRKKKETNWEVVLTQFDTQKSLDRALTIIGRAFHAPNVKIRQQQQTEDGLILEQARVYLPALELVRSIVF